MKTLPLASRARRCNLNVVPSLALLALGISFAAGATAQTYQAELPGLTGAAYGNSSYAMHINASGQVFGRTELHGAGMGYAAWIYSNGSTQRIGLTGAGYADPFGRADSWVIAGTSAGDAIGWSERFDGYSSVGRTGWLYSNGVTRQIGLTGSGYTDSRGNTLDGIAAINASGQVIGGTTQYLAGAEIGWSAWIYSNGNVQRIGLAGAGYTGMSASSQSGAVALNDAGQVIGYSTRYSNNSGNGSAAWLYSNGSTQEIGLVGAGYTNTATGYNFNEVVAINRVGQAIGTAFRYNGSNPDGRDAWIYSNGNTQQIGLGNDSVAAINGAGEVIGRSGSLKAWLYSNGSTQALGLTGAGYTTTYYGGAVSKAFAINDAGQVVGTSERFESATSPGTKGQSVWLYSHGVTEEIGLTGVGYTRDDGRSFNDVTAFNGAGQAVGKASRYSGSNDLGEAAWFYDDSQGKTFALTFSVAANGRARTEVSFLGEDGLVLGRFEDFSNNGDVFKAFAWTVSGGLKVLDTLFDPGASADLSSLVVAYKANGADQILGRGLGSDGIEVAVLLTPVPEPTSASLMLAGFGLLAWRARRIMVRSGSVQRSMVR